MGSSQKIHAETKISLVRPRGVGTLGGTSMTDLLTRSISSAVKVNAKVLYPYIVLPGFSYKTWTNELAVKAASITCIRNLRVTKEPDGEFSLNLDCVYFYLHLTVQDIVAAIGFLLVSEALEGKHGDAPDAVNRALSDHVDIAGGSGIIAAERLHQFLGIDTDYKCWIADIKKRHRMRLHADYKSVRLKHGVKAMVFKPRFAMIVASEAQTSRGRFIKDFFDAEEEASGKFPNISKILAGGA